MRVLEENPICSEGVIVKIEFSRAVRPMDPCGKTRVGIFDTAEVIFTLGLVLKVARNRIDEARNPLRLPTFVAKRRRRVQILASAGGDTAGIAVAMTRMASASTPRDAALYVFAAEGW